MNSGLIPLNGPKRPAAEPDWQKQLESWRELLDKCGRKPNKKHVHGLRVVTLRLQVQAEHWLREHATEDGTARAAVRWNKQAEKLRKALSPIRDSDVYQQMLKGLRNPVAGEAAETCRASLDSAREIDKLERRLKRSRVSAEKKLRGAIDKRGKRLNDAGRQLQEGLASPTVWAGIDCAAAVREIVRGLAVDAPGLTAETLHEFRKRAKTARYLAEIVAGQDGLAKKQAALLKKMQGIAGSWHDWQMLAEKTESELGAREGAVLVHLLNSMAERTLERALGECRRITVQLVVLGRESDAASKTVPRKKLVRRVESAVRGQRYA